MRKYRYTLANGEEVRIEATKGHAEEGEPPDATIYYKDAEGCIFEDRHGILKVDFCKPKNARGYLQRIWDRAPEDIRDHVIDALEGVVR